MQVNGMNTQGLQQSYRMVANTAKTAARAAESSFASALNHTAEVPNYTLSFPPKDAPATLKQAYDNLPDSDKFALSATALGMSAQANVRRGPDGKMTLVRPGEPGFVDIYGQPNLTVGDFLNQMKVSVTNDEKVAGYTTERDHVIELVNRLIQHVTQSGDIYQPLRTSS